MLLLRLAMRNVRRNVHRTVLTAGTVVFGTALLTVALAWLTGVFGTLTNTMASFGGHARVMTTAFAAREELMPLSEHLQHADDLAAAAMKLPGVRAAYPRIVTGVTLTKGDEIGDQFGLAVGAPIGWYTDQLHLGKDIVLGTMFTGADGETVLGRTVAEAIHAQVGDTIIALGMTQDGAMAPVKAKVVGIASGGNQLVDNGIFLPLEPLRWMADVDDGATELLIYGDDKTQGKTLAAELRADPAFSNDVVQAWDEQPSTAGIVAMIGVVNSIISSIIVFVCALGVWNTMMMSVMERTREIGVMRAMGLTRPGTVVLFVVEGLFIAAIGGAVGVALGCIPAYALQVYGVNLGDKMAHSAGVPVQSHVYALLTVGVVTEAFLLGLCTALVGTAFPAWRAASIQPVDAMRSR